MDSILIVEDEAALRMTLSDRLRKLGYGIDYAEDGEQGVAKAVGASFDLIILDVMLPRRDGLDVCRDIRASGVVTPVLMLTARARTSDKVTGLKVGADDYLTKPFKMPELLARVEALLRRPPHGRCAPPDVYRFGGVRVDLRGTEVVRHGRRVGMTALEFELLRFFVENAGVTLSREDLLTRVWGYSASALTRTVDVHVAGLRQKLEDDPRHPRFLVTVQGVGYKFKPHS